MGLFDRIWFECPTCEAPVEVQSKAGRCVLEDISSQEVPEVIGISIEGESIWCDGGHGPFTVVTAPRPKVMRMVLI